MAMIVAANVAAACAIDIENINPTSGMLRSKIRPESHAAIPLPRISATANQKANRKVSPWNITAGSNSNPTETRKVGMKKALPKKSVTVISGLAFGTSRFRPTPAKKAPISASIPTNSATTADEVRLISTTM